VLCVGPAGEAAGAGAGAGYTQTTSPADPSTVVTGASTKEKLIYARSPTPKTSTLSAVEGVCGTPTPGTSTPLGAHVDANAVNFAVHAHSQVRSVSLLLFTRDTLKQNSINGGLPVAELELDAASHRTGSVWHVRLDNLAPGLLYAWRIVGPTKEDIFPTTAASPNLPVSDAVAAAAAPSTPQTTTDPATGAPVPTANLLNSRGARCDPKRVVMDPRATQIVWGNLGTNADEYGVVPADGNCWPARASPVPNVNEMPFDWEGDTPPGIDISDLVVYECHVRGFTRHPSSGVASQRGTYAALAERASYFKRLGINAVELLPVNEFNELEYHSDESPIVRRNFWGYSTVGFFAPMSRYASDAANVRNEFKNMVKALHAEGIEVILDVVFNHTAEGNEYGPVLSFRGLDDEAYYMVGDDEVADDGKGGHYYNYSGCGNTMAANHPVCRQFVLDCLRHWVTEYHVDGFRFDLASALTRAPRYSASAAAGGAGHPDVPMGTPLELPPLIDAINEDPVLRGRAKLIAEAWDCGGLYQVGNFPGGKRGGWLEWNGKFRDSVRNFIKGTDGQSGAFADALCGFPSLYGDSGRGPWASVNFITCHDGFTLRDLVSYNSKQNIANGEDNRDGEEHNLSWNCGDPGDEGDPQHLKLPVKVLRARQMRNFFVALFVAQGTPMVTMGDESGMTKGGNNNTYCHDNELNWLVWDAAMRGQYDEDGLNELPRRENDSADDSALVQFVGALAELRSNQPSLRLKHYPDDRVLQWHGPEPNQPIWAEEGVEDRLVCFEWKRLPDQPPAAAASMTAMAGASAAAAAAPVAAPKTFGELIAQPADMYVAFNAGHESVTVNLPHIDTNTHRWISVVDTSRPAPMDALCSDTDEAVAWSVQGALSPWLNNANASVLLKPRSSVILLKCKA